MCKQNIERPADKNNTAKTQKVISPRLFNNASRKSPSYDHTDNYFIMMKKFMEFTRMCTEFDDLMFDHHGDYYEPRVTSATRPKKGPKSVWVPKQA